jgi:tetratricopeptide (TPR) repeat protein
VIRLLVVLALLGGGGLTEAAEADPDTEVAQRLFHEGVAAYGAHDYAHALDKFEEARRLKPLPAFDFNIARCHDRLGHAQPALDAYQRYLAAAPDAPDAPEVRARIEVLRARIEPVPSTAPVPERPTRRWAAPIAVGVVGVALLGTGGGLVGSVGPDYDALDRRWRAEGPTPGVIDTADALRSREIAGWTLLGVGGAALIVDAVLWGVASRKRGAN